jgi:hypothetical protein
MCSVRTNLKLFVSLVLCLGFAGACKSNDKPGSDNAASSAPAAAAPAAPAAASSFACTKPGNWCMDYSGDALMLGEAGLKGMCGAMGGSLASGKCTTAKALGSCDLSKGQVKTYYPSEDNNAGGAKSDCDLHDGKYAAAAP